MVEESTSDRSIEIGHDVRDSVVVSGDGNQVTYTQTQIIQISANEVKTQPFIVTSPYKGLKKFEQTDKDRFFGREQFARRLVNDLNQTNLLLLLGASGSGKSSVVRAGLVPQLAQQWGDRFINLTFTPDHDPFESLYASLLNHYRQADTQFVRQGKVETLVQMVKKLKSADAYWLIFIDQFEELFTTSQLEKCNQFIAGLAQLNGWLKKFSIQNCRVKVLTAMRSDFLDRLSPYPELVKATDHARPIIAELQPDELRLAIEQPAAHHGVVFEDGLAEEIIKNVEGQAGYLPLLQYTLNLLWETEVETGGIHDRTLNISTYRELGGVRGALQKHVDQIYGALSKEEQLAAQRIFLKLVDIGKSGESEADWKPSRRRALRSSFSDGLEQRILTQLIDANLLVSDRPLQVSESTVEVAHEVLLTAWTTLESWIRENRQAIALRNRLDDDVARWKEKKSEDELWSGSKLAKTLELREDPTFSQVLGGFSDITDQFIEASVGLRDQQLKKARRTAVVGFALATLAGTASLIAIWTSLQASNREATARSLQLATASSANLNLDTTRSLLLAIQATITQDTPQANLALWNSFQLNHERWLLLGHKAGIKYAEFDPRNPKRILTVSSDHTARVWNLDNLSHPIILEGHRDAIINGSFDSVNSNRVLTVSFDGTARVWDLTAPNNPIVLIGHRGPINYGMFDPKNSNRVLTVSSDGTARIWNINNPKAPIIFQGHKGSIWGGSFDPQDSNRILTVGNDGTARIWNVNTPESSITLKGHSGDVLYGSFDPKNHNRALTVGADRTLRVWDLSNSTHLLVFKGHEAPITMASFDPFNKDRVLTVSKDSTARVWNLDHPENLPTVLRGHKGEVAYGSFNPNVPDQVLTVGADGTARVWDLKNSETPKYILNGHTSKIVVGIFSSNNSLVLTASEDGTARIWDISNSMYKQLSSFRKIDYGYLNATFNIKKGNQILAVGRDGTFKEWDLDQPELPTSLSNLGLMDKVFFAPSDPNIVAAIGKNGQAYVWNLSTAKKLLNKFPGDENIRNISFDSSNPNRLLLVSENLAIIWDLNQKKFIKLSVSSGLVSHGLFNPSNDNQIVIADSKGFVSVWDIRDTKRPLSEINVSREEIWHISFDPNNSSRVVAVGSDKIAHILDIKNRNIIKEFVGHQDAVTFASFDPSNSNRILTLSNDGKAYIWDQRYPNSPLMLYSSNTNFISGGFDPYNPNRIVIVSDDGVVKIFIVGGKELLKLAWLQSSRCLTKQESNGYELSTSDISKELSDYLKQSLKLLAKQKYRPFCSTQ